MSASTAASAARNRSFSSTEPIVTRTPSPGKGRVTTTRFETERERSGRWSSWEPHKVCLRIGQGEAHNVDRRQHSISLGQRLGYPLSKFVISRQAGQRSSLGEAVDGEGDQRTVNGTDNIGIGKQVSNP